MIDKDKRIKELEDREKQLEELVEKLFELIEEFPISFNNTHTKAVDLYNKAELAP